MSAPTSRESVSSAVEAIETWQAIWYRLEEIVAQGGCAAIGQILGDIRGGAMIVGLRRDAEFHPQPPAGTHISPRDILVALGTPKTLIRLEDLMAPLPTVGGSGA